MLTNKGKYGLKAMVHLAGLEPGVLAQVQDMADANSIPKKFLDQILSELRNAGLVFSKKGKGGGYALAQPASQITVGRIVRVLDGPLAPIQCASVTAYRPCHDCSDERICAVRLMMVKARNALADVLDHQSLVEMRALGQIKPEAPAQVEPGSSSRPGPAHLSVKNANP
ncbi:MAG TPA: Rrf2 family transcriptional regulator [Rhodoblastus sp.]|nr:Rrf2 family transcriptional regulator [Rhodoblastus sp.]